MSLCGNNNPCPDLITGQKCGITYTGARYVPLFADPAEWSSANAYEPLTIVIHEGNSYTSKTFVPVGVDISNEQYWALTGNYNAQVEGYRKEVRELSKRVKQRLITVDTINELRNYDDLTVGYYIMTGGYYFVNDGGESLYYIDYTTSGDIDDGGSTIIVGNVACRLINKEVNVKQFGAHGDGVSDDLVYIQNAVNYSNSVFFPQATYIISGVIKLKSDTSLIGEGATIKNINNKEYDVQSSPMIYCANINNILIKNIQFNGNKNNLSSTNDDPTFSYYGIYILDCKNVEIVNCKFYDIKQSSINIVAGVAESSQIYVHNCVFNDNWSALIITESPTNNVFFYNNTVNNCQEHGFTTYKGCYDIYVNNNTITNCGLRTADAEPGPGLYNYGSCIRFMDSHNCVASNNYVENARFYPLRITFNNDASLSYNNKFIGNTVVSGSRKGDKAGGIECSGTNNVVSNNIVRDFTLDLLTAIVVNNNLNNITDNIIDNCYNGISLNGNSLNVVNNILNNINNYGIFNTTNTNTINLANNIINSGVRKITLQTDTKNAVLNSNNYGDDINGFVYYGYSKPIKIDGLYYSTEIPTVGSYKQGDICIKKNVGGTALIGWICVADGEPGTWQPMSVTP